MAKKQRVVKQEKLTDICPVRKKRDRFDGLTEDEVLTRTLPDHLAYDLDILIVWFCIDICIFTALTEGCVVYDMALCLCVCVCDCHKSEFCENG